MPLMKRLPIVVCLGLLVPFVDLCVSAGAAGVAPDAAKEKEEAKKPALPLFAKDVQPLIAKYCYGCHGNGKTTGGIVLDKYKDEESVQKKLKLWEKVADNLRSGT